MKKFTVPMILKDEQFVEPGTRAYYLLSADGLFLVKKFQIYSSCIKVEKGLPWLANHSEYIDLHLPRIPRAMLERVVAFFYLVYRLYDSEAIVFLYYHPEKRSFKVWVPEQEVEAKSYKGQVIGSYHLDYSGAPTPPGFVRLGTIHSHADMQAFYSITDEKDSKFDDSLNIVVGNLGKRQPSFFACFMVNGRLFELDPKDISESFQRLRFPVPRSWLDQVFVK